MLPNFVKYNPLCFAEVMHCFEIRTANIDYFVGEDPMFGREEQDIQLPPAESGVGAHLAKSWETSIRQALMPVASGNTSECRRPL